MLVSGSQRQIGLADFRWHSRLLCLILPSVMGLLTSAAWGQPTIETVATFNGTNGLGFGYGLTSDSDGDIYGSTSMVGGDGAIFQLVNGTMDTLVSLNSTNGWGATELSADAFGNVYAMEWVGESGNGISRQDSPRGRG